MAHDSNGVDWRDKIIEIHLEDSLLKTAKKHVAATTGDLHLSISEIISDGASIKIRWVDRYQCYTLSTTFPKADKTRGGLTFWFYWGDLAEGLALMRWLKSEVIPDMAIRTDRLNRTLTF